MVKRKRKERVGIIWERDLGAHSRGGWARPGLDRSRGGVLWGRRRASWSDLWRRSGQCEQCGCFPSSQEICCSLPHTTIQNPNPMSVLVNGIRKWEWMNEWMRMTRRRRTSFKSPLSYNKFKIKIRGIEGSVLLCLSTLHYVCVFVAVCIN